MFTLLAKILIALNSEAEPKQLAWAVAFAALAGFNPLAGVLSLLSFMLVVMLRVNLAIFFAMFAVFTGFSVVLAPVFHFVGEGVLHSQSMTAFWTDLYQSYWFRIFHYNNTKVLGASIISVIAFVPIYFLSLHAVVKYRKTIMAYINKFKVVQSLKASKFYRVYQTVAQQ